MGGSGVTMGGHSSPIKILIPSEKYAPLDAQRPASETDAISDLQSLDDGTALFGGDACFEEQSLKDEALTSSGNKNVDHNFDSRHWDGNNVRELRVQDKILLNSGRSDSIHVINEDSKMQHGNCSHPTEQIYAELMVGSVDIDSQYRKLCSLREKLLEKAPTTQSVVHTTPLTKSNLASQPAEFARKGIDTMSCPKFQNDGYDVDDESIKTALSELKQSVNEITRSFCSKGKPLNDETVVWKDVYDDNSQFRYPSPLSTTSNQSSELPWSAPDTKILLIKEIGEVKSSVKKLGKEIRSSLPSAVCPHSGLTTRKTLTNATDGLYSGDVTLSHGFECSATFQIPESVDFPKPTKDTNKDARVIDKESLTGYVNPIVVNEQERLKTSDDNVLKPYATCLEYPHFSSKAETHEQGTSKSSDKFARSMRDQAEGVLESDLDESRPLENASGSTVSLNSSVKSEDVQEDLLDRMLQILQNLHDVFTSDHHLPCKGVCPRALETVNFLKDMVKHDSIPQAFGANKNVSYLEQNGAVNSPSSCMSTASSSFLEKVKHIDLMNHTSAKINRSKPQRVTPIQKTWRSRTNFLECPIELRPRETLNGRIKRVICELYGEIQPLEDGIKEKALAMLEEIHGIVELLQIYEQSGDFIASNEMPSFDTQQEFASYFKASSCEPSRHFFQDICNDFDAENERYNESNRSLRQETVERDSPYSQTNQTTTYSLSIENIRGRIKSLIHKHSDLTPEETNRKILSVLRDMEKVLDTFGDQNPPMLTDPSSETKAIMHAEKANVLQQSQFAVSSRMSILIGNLQNVILDMRPDLQIADYDPQSKICFLLNILTDELQSERTESSALKDVEDLLKRLENELCQQGEGNSILTICIREMIEVVTIVGANLVLEEKPKCKSKALTNDATCRKGEVRCENVCKKNEAKIAVDAKSHKEGNSLCKSEPKVIEELFMNGGEDCETIPCETVKMVTATCGTSKVEEKHVCKSEPSYVRKRAASTEKLQSCHGTTEQNREIGGPCPSDAGKVPPGGNGEKMDCLVATEEYFTAPNRCYNEVKFKPTEPTTACTQAPDSLLAQILAELQDLMKELETEGFTLQKCAILKILETFNHIETTLESDPQYNTLLREARKTIGLENGGKREPRSCFRREGSCSRWCRLSRRHRNRSNCFTSGGKTERFFEVSPKYVKKHVSEVNQGKKSPTLSSI
ncbi:hypothetical protein EGR_08176 [Echinococcus granulosus]|uniref:Uncharacterized protein n=1 Tax=Echinococcus granulosus TaxID=6210 RepID=W6UU98_ECHGR|nr:hypothetical protein EGR_08176 [Echinococcus granulosus]EUB56939.1 hypothetical protein EGR_08176 [Echinococcus granulosus]